MASAARFYWVPVIATTNLTFWSEMEILGIWSVIEPGLGIVAACMATLRPLLRHVKRELRSRPALLPFGLRLWRRYDASSTSKSTCKETTQDSKTLQASSNDRYSKMVVGSFDRDLDLSGKHGSESFNNHYVRYNPTPKLEPVSELEKAVIIGKGFYFDPLSTQQELATFNFGFDTQNDKDFDTAQLEIEATISSTRNSGSSRATWWPVPASSSITARTSDDESPPRPP